MNEFSSSRISAIETLCHSAVMLIDCYNDQCSIRRRICSVVYLTVVTFLDIFCHLNNYHIEIICVNVLVQCKLH